MLQNRNLAWVVTILALAFTALNMVYEPLFPAVLPGGIWIFLVFALGELGLAFIVLTYFMRLSDQREELRLRAEKAEKASTEAYQRLDIFFRIGQKFVQASDENEVVDLVLCLSIDLVGAMGAAFVPIDEHGQPLAAISQGRLPPLILDDWLEYLASPGVRDRCKDCENHGALASSANCPLLKAPFTEAIGMFCLPLRRGEREFGVLNLFIPKVNHLDEQAEALLRAMLDETALALESVRLRRRELDALRQTQALREKSDLNGMLAGLLESIFLTLEGDFALLQVASLDGSRAWVDLVRGDFPGEAQPFIDGVVRGVKDSGEPVLLGDVTGGKLSTSGLRSLLAAPLLAPNRSGLGVILVGNRRARTFSQRQLAVLQTVATQVSLLVQNANLIAELEYKTLIGERTRLAREIHDGLAQTLGFLKLQTAQMQNYLARQDYEHLQQSLKLSYETLSEAYQDARQAIDGLRIEPAENGLAGWIIQTVNEFKDMAGLPVDVDGGRLHTDLPPEVHSQLIRIVQEALSNIRKHARAGGIWISYYEDSNDLWLEVRDDGIGFLAEDVPGPSRHGLRGMRERAELIGADFQVISQLGEGTRVRVRLPLAGLAGLSNSKTGKVII